MPATTKRLPTTATENLKMPKQEFVLNEGNALELSAADDKKASRTFKMKAYSGAPVSRFGFSLIIDLAGISTKQKTPILKNHDPDQIVGMSDSIEKTADGLMITGKLSSKTQAAREVAELADEDYEWQASVKCEVDEVQYLSENQVETVNGRQVKGPNMAIARKSRLRESSFCPVGADGDTSAAVFSFFAEEQKKMSTQNNPPAAGEDKSKDVLSAERARVAALKAKFPKHAAFALEQIEAGNSVEQAELAFKDVLLAERDAEIVALKAQTSAQKPGAPGTPPPAPVTKTGAEPVVFSGSENGGGNAGGGFMEQAKALAASKNVKLSIAVAELAASNPDLHAKYVEDCRSGNKK
jgi:hypothetical protein